MEIQVKPDCEVVGSRIYSTIFVVIDSIAYPYENWKDFSLTCLTCWYDAIEKCRVNRKTDLMFFDGDAKIALHKKPNDCAILSFTVPQKNDLIVCFEKTSNILKEIFDACKRIRIELEEKGVTCKELSALDTWIKERSK